MFSPILPIPAFGGKLAWPEGPPSGSHTRIGKQGNPSIDFLVVIMTSGIAHGHDDEDE